MPVVNTGTVSAVNGNLVTATFEGHVRQSEVAYVVLGDKRLKSEVIRIEGDRALCQVYEETRGLATGDSVEFTGELLSVTLGPGLLGQVYDGLQNPLPELAEAHGFFLPRGVSLPALDEDRRWDFEPAVKPGDNISGGDVLGSVQEGSITHRILAPFDLNGSWKVARVAEKGPHAARSTVAAEESPGGETRELSMFFEWPVRVPVTAYRERLMPDEPLVTGCRIIDSLFPVAKGGSFCTPGPFGAGKTVLQQTIARYADVDVVIIAACGERAGEVVETLKEFPEIEDIRTGRSLMERTIIIANTSSMPVASRESSVYTAVTLAEYYRQMGLNVLLLADSTSRWAQAMREMSGRLEEIPGEEAFPAYLESRIASFYERAGRVRLADGETGSVTIGGTVSPAGGTFEEPVTQATLKVVGAFLGLSRARSSARRFPAIDPIESWSNYEGVISADQVRRARVLLKKGRDAQQMMKVVGEEGTAMEDYLAFQKAELLDAAYLQQNAFDEVDAATPKDRQRHVFGLVSEILDADLAFEEKDAVLKWFQNLRNTFINWNYAPYDSEKFRDLEAKIRAMLEERKAHEEDS